MIEENTQLKLVEPRHSALHNPALVDPFASDIDWSQREKEMFSIMHNSFGIGLASPQLGESYNMFVMYHSTLGDIGIYKPEILEFSDETVSLEEGCLTFPMLYLNISRPQKVNVRYLKADGKTLVETWLDGIDARCFQHEYDHLQGKLFLDLVSELKLKRAHKKREKFFLKLQRKIGR